MKLLELGEGKGLDVYVMRPSGVTPKEGAMAKIAGFLPMIRVDELAAAAVDIAMHGSEMRTLENGDLVKRGREALKSG